MYLVGFDTGVWLAGGGYYWNGHERNRIQIYGLNSCWERIRNWI